MTDAPPADTSPLNAGPVSVLPSHSMYVAQYLAPHSSSVSMWWNIQSLFTNIRSGCLHGKRTHLWERLPNSSHELPVRCNIKRAFQLLFLWIYQEKENWVWELEGPWNGSHRNYPIPILAFRSQPWNEGKALHYWSPALPTLTCDRPSTRNIQRPSYHTESSVVMLQETCEGPQEFRAFSWVDTWLTR